MSIASESYAPTPADASRRWQDLHEAGLNVRLEDLAPGARLLHTAFGFGPEIWLLEPDSDPLSARIDDERKIVIGGRLVVNQTGEPALPKAVAARGFHPVLDIPTI